MGNSTVLCGLAGIGADGHAWVARRWMDLSAPGTYDYPQARGGALVALFFLSAGRISYKASPIPNQSLVLDVWHE